eukprot:Gb_28995 [translate_table: standard]
MERKKLRCSLLIIGILTVIFAAADGTTDQQDVSALSNVYTNLNSPQQLTGWSANGGDPCGQSWKGVSCSGSSVISIKLSGLGLSGSLYYQLSNLASLTILDLSNNNIQNNIPYALPPKLQQMNLAGNSLSGNLPYSISTITSLNYLNVSHNQLSGQITDVFGQLSSLNSLDLSFNNLAQNLPQGFSSLSSLNVLHLQNNQITGSINVLAHLPLTDLNIENNHFSGWVPNELKSINPQVNGNNFTTGPAPPPPPYTPPPPSNEPDSPAHKSPNTRSSSGGSMDQGNDKGGLSGGAIAGIVIAVLAAVAAVLVIAFFARKSSKGGQDEEKLHAGVTFSPLATFTAKASKESSELKIRPSPPEITLKPPPSERHKSTGDKGFGSMFASKRTKSPITATEYSIADLQMATSSFSQDNLIGEGAVGRVYRADFPNGKILAVKKMDISSLSLQKPEDFLEAVSNMSRLHHSNITELVGYCTEHGQYLLVYEYFDNGALHEILHMADETNIKLTWNARVRIALGTARALEYLHEVCSPSVVHRNLKSANILLDDELNPHLADCGIAALNPNSEHQVSTQMAGSFGYSAPEYAMSGVYTVKSDVYSFGVVMLELLTGRKPLDSSRPRSEQSLVRWATPQLHDIDALAKMVDPALKGIYPAKSLSRFADIIALCVQPEPEFRPPMSEVVQALVRLMQRAGLNKRISGDDSYRNSDHDPSDSSV